MAQNRPKQQADTESQNQTCLTFPVILGITICLAVPHLVIGGASVLIGLALVSRAPVVLANTIAPIWCGGIYIVTSLFGFYAAKTKTSYMMCCFGGFAMVSLMVGTISIQLLRMGLVDLNNHGQVYMKEEIDEFTVVGVALAGAECIISVVTAITSFMMANSLKKRSGLEEPAEPTKEQLMAERQEEIRKEKLLEQKQQEKRLMQKARLARSYQKV